MPSASPRPSLPRCREISSADICTDASADPMRCVCGALIARLVRGGVELKCRRCKRTVLVALSDDAAQ